MSNVARVKDKVQTYLANNFPQVSLFGDNGFSLDFDSARVHVEIDELGAGTDEPRTWVRLTSVVLTHLQPSEALYRYVAEHAMDYRIGAMCLSEQGDGTLWLMMGYGFLADYLDEEELRFAVMMLMVTADSVDDELKAEFGGKRFFDE